jgi:hypothetical protein
MISNLCIDFDAFRVWGKGSDGNRQQSDCLSIACEGAKKIVFLSKGLFSGFSSYFFGSESSSKPASFESSSESSSKPASPEPSSELSWDAPLEELFGAADVSEKSNSAIGKLGKRKVTDETYTNSSIVTKIRNFFSSKIEQFVQWVVSLFRGNNSGAMAQNQDDNDARNSTSSDQSRDEDKDRLSSSFSSESGFVRLESNKHEEPVSPTNISEKLLPEEKENFLKQRIKGAISTKVEDEQKKAALVDAVFSIISQKIKDMTIQEEGMGVSDLRLPDTFVTIILENAVNAGLSDISKDCILNEILPGAKRFAEMTVDFLRRGAIALATSLLEGRLKNLQININGIIGLRIDLNNHLIEFDEAAVRTDAPNAKMLSSEYEYTLTSIEFADKEMVYLHYATTSNSKETWYYPITCDQFIKIFGTLDWKESK